MTISTSVIMDPYHNYSQAKRLPPENIKGMLEKFVNSPDLEFEIIYKLAVEIIHDKNNLMHSDIELLKKTRDTLIRHKEGATAYPETQAKLEVFLKEFEKLTAKGEEIPKTPALPKGLWLEIAKRADLHSALQTTQVRKEFVANRQERLLADFNDANVTYNFLKFKAIVEKYPELKPRITCLKLRSDYKDLRYLKENCPNLKYLRYEKFANYEFYSITSDDLPNLKKLEIINSKPLLKTLPPTLEYLKLNRCAIYQTPIVEDRAATPLKELELQHVTFFNGCEATLFEGLDKLTISGCDTFIPNLITSPFCPLNLSGFKGRYLKIDKILGPLPATVTHLTTTFQVNFDEFPAGLKELRIESSGWTDKIKNIQLLKKVPSDATIFRKFSYTFNTDIDDDLNKVEATLDHMPVTCNSISMEKLPPKIKKLSYYVFSSAINITEEELRKGLSNMPKTLNRVKFNIFGDCSQEVIALFQRVLLDSLPQRVHAEIKFGIYAENKISFSKR